jgi:pimeloyl-ACP methyl ester carboxylesterase
MQEAELGLYSGRTIDVPAAFVAGAQDWGAWQVPGALERMQRVACPAMRFCRFIDGAGHWVQQEQPEATTAAIMELLAPLRP